VSEFNSDYNNKANKIKVLKKIRVRIIFNLMLIVVHLIFRMFYKQKVDAHDECNLN
jgi:uncharacterized ion transporter superfamily protein YfcC